MLNIRFTDIVSLVGELGFALVRVRGSHHIFQHPSVTELLNLQQVDGKAKPYQVRQLRRLIGKYNLKLSREQ